MRLKFWRPRTPSKRQRARVLAKASALAVAAGLLAAPLAMAPAAHAADPQRVGQGIEITGVTEVGTTWLGAVGRPNTIEALVFCLQAGLWSPSGEDVVDMSLIEGDPVLVRLMEDLQDQDVADIRAMIAYLVHVRHDLGSNGVSAADRRAAVEANTPQHIKDLANATMAATAPQAGPYAGEPGASGYTVAKRQGVVNNIGLQSAAGQWQAGKPVTVTLDGPAVFDATGTNTWTGTTVAGPLSLPWTATGNGTVTYRVKFNNVGRTTLTRIDSTGNVQAVATTGNRLAGDPEEIEVPGPAFDVNLDFRIQGTTQVQNVVVAKGDPLIDTLRVQAHPEDVWAPGEGGDEYVDMVGKLSWYGPYSVPQAQQATVPAGAPVAGSETFTATGPGEMLSPGTVNAPADGFYTAVMSFDKADQGANEVYLRENWSAPFFEEVETSVVKAKIAHRSMAREYNVAPGGQAFDTITIDGMPTDHGTFAGLGKWAPDTQTATVRAYGPLEAAPSTVEVPEGTPFAYETTVEAVNGVYDIGYDPTDPVTMPQATTYPTGDHYVFVYSFAGDDRVEAYTSAFNDVRERFFVPGPQEPVEEPSVITQAQPEATVGEEFDDVALVTGKTEPGDYLVFEAHGPLDPEAAPTCDAEPFFTSEKIEVTGQGYYSSGKTTASAPGNVYWVETLYAEDGTVKHEGECGAPGETTVVKEGPWVTTKATSDNGDAPVVGDEIWDTVQIGGKFPTGSTITVDLFYAEPGKPLTCESPIWTSQKIAVVDGVTEYQTGKYPTKDPGTHGYVERTETPDGKVIVEGKCGEPDETLIVKVTPAPKPVVAEPTKPMIGGVLPRTGATVAGLLVAAIVAAGAGTWVLIARNRRAGAGA